MEIRPEQPSDRASVARVVEAAFGAEEGPVVAGLVDGLRTSGAARLGLVAEDDGVVVGHVLLSHSWVDADRRVVEVLVLSPLSVAPDHQGRGTGTALVAAALAAAEELGAPTVFLEGDPGFYGSRGFTRAADHGFVRPSDRIPQAAFQVAVLPGHEEWMTGRLAYADAFWQLDCVGLRGDVLAAVRANVGD
ncbi:MAG: N-acetyltransferase [Nocardioidaceae bacterium]